ncbi:hypothetical protein CPB85DRAFT_1340476 [Mucidula mucida]|nr:hypothetical protein CPB85DRAFT_1340476 [Mucidula mucida]
MATAVKPPTPVLTVARAEQVTHNPLTFTSTLSIPRAALLRRRHQPEGPEILTDSCGLGWTFGIQTHRLPERPSVPKSVLQPVLAAARSRRRLTIVDSSSQESIPTSDRYLKATNLTVRAHFDSSTIAFAGHLGIKHISCTLRAPGPEGITRSCDKVSVVLAETIVIGTFNYEHPSDYKEGGSKNGEEDTFMFTFVVEMGHGRIETKTIPQQAERRAAAGLAESIRTGCMVDTKFYLYSKRTENGGAYHPKEIYASSAILRGFNDDLDLLLASHGCKGSESVPLDLFELQDEDMETEAYDYPGEDSDLEGPISVRIPWPSGSSPPSRCPSEVGRCPSEVGRSSPPSRCPSPPSRCLSPFIIKCPLTPLPQDSPVLMAEDDSPRLIEPLFREPIRAPTSQPEDESSCDPAIPSASVPKDDEDGNGDKVTPTNEDLTVALTHVQDVTEKNFMRMGRVIVMKDTAFATWEALIRYIYFNEIHFNSLGALPAQGGCSPKSMYRLADKFGIQILKNLALENIKGQLSVRNVTGEVFSRFSSLYPEILQAEIEFLLNNCEDSSVHAGISRALQSLTTGEHDYRLDALQRIMIGLPARSLTKPKLCSQSFYCHSCRNPHYR